MDNKHRTQQLTAIPTIKRERKRLMKRFPGVLFHVSTALGVRRSTVTNVWALRDGSEKITDALLAEFNRRLAERESSEEGAA